MISCAFSHLKEGKIYLFVILASVCLVTLSAAALSDAVCSSL